MRRKLIVTAAASVVVGLLLWSSQQPNRTATHEDAPAPSAGRASTPSPSTAERRALEMPPPLALPSDAGAAPDAAAATAGDAQARDGFPNFLPEDAIATLRAIERGGPYPYRQDDGVFRNRERELPPRPHGYYREYTVETPGARDRGARRIVTGGRPPVEYFYTDDHYRSFRRFTRDGGEGRAP